MKKIYKFTFVLLSAVSLILGITSTSFSKVEGNKIILGAAVSLTGKYSTNGKNTKNGYNLAVERINEMGGIKVGGKTYEFDIIYYDDESKGDRAAALAERLIKQDGVKYMLGPYSSGMTKAIAPVTEENKIPMVEANGASRSLFTKGYKYLFAVLSAANQYLEVAIDLAVEKNGGKPVKIAMAIQPDPFSADVAIGIREADERTGSEIILDEKLPKELNDMASILAKVKVLKPDVLAVSGHTKGAVTAIKQIAEFKVNVPMLAMTHCDAGKLSKTQGTNAQYALCAAQWHKSLSYKDKYFGTGLAFDADYTEKYGEAPPYQAAESAAALLVWKSAFERANSFDTEKVRDALAKTDMQTFYGNVKFSKAGQNIAKPMVLFQVICGDDGKCENKVVAPTKWASAELVHPIPLWSSR